MKLKLLIAAATVAGLSAFALVPLAEKDIIGNWKVDAASLDTYTKHIIDKAAEANPGEADQMEEHKDEIKAVVKSMQLNFKPDFTYEMTSVQGGKAGKWKLTNGGKSLAFTRADGSTRVDSVLELTATRLKLINRELRDTALFVRP